MLSLIFHLLLLTLLLDVDRASRSFGLPGTSFGESTGYAVDFLYYSSIYLRKTGLHFSAFSHLFPLSLEFTTIYLLQACKSFCDLNAQ